LKEIVLDCIISSDDDVVVVGVVVVVDALSNCTAFLSIINSSCTSSTSTVLISFDGSFITFASSIDSFLDISNLSSITGIDFSPKVLFYMLKFIYPARPCFGASYLQIAKPASFMYFRPENL